MIGSQKKKILPFPSVVCRILKWPKDFHSLIYNPFPSIMSGTVNMIG